MEDLVGFADGVGCGPSEPYVVFVFAGDGTENLIRTAIKGGLAQTATAFSGGHCRARFCKFKLRNS